MTEQYIPTFEQNCFYSPDQTLEEALVWRGLIMEAIEEPRKIMYREEYDGRVTITPAMRVGIRFRASKRSRWQYDYMVFGKQR